MKIISKVNNLTRHELIYVFDKMNVGDSVELSHDDKNKITWVIYNNRKIGTLDAIDFGFWGLGSKIVGTINSISLNKYLPFENLDIEIKPTF
ncbi:MAG: hypothetical protein R2799_01220 [Crocinitomicaceae bacterium]